MRTKLIGIHTVDEIIANSARIAMNDKALCEVSLMEEHGFVEVCSYCFDMSEEEKEKNDVLVIDEMERLRGRSNVDWHKGR